MAQKDQPRMVVVAQFAGTHGVRGDFKLRSYTEEPEALFGYGPLRAEGGASLTPKKLREMKPGVFLCRDAEISSPEAAESFKGKLLSVPRDVLPETDDEDDFYVEDLIGLDAKTEEGEGLGKVRAVTNYGAGDIVEIKGKGGLILVPFTKDAVPAIDFEAATIVVVPPEDEAGPRD
ncbi:16S rRNA processing protein RimM [Parvularcula sp. ZS-1/3]|uniref:Ribosome maturation factor RimM n=1 Tax=Parvularcula mediterranea TaxID=2732508 RepID=A0A7Y3W4Z6_9PROT|nr:ribosome maturation factor RimM [Parvularcula mediterranea]NNU15711.1 16S rRNA processing protein RimM [Parvularcula mediterranea]